MKNSLERLIIPQNGEGSPRFKSRGIKTKPQGATEQDQGDQRINTGMQGQLGHRDQDAELKDADSALPG